MSKKLKGEIVQKRDDGVLITRENKMVVDSNSDMIPYHRFHKYNKNKKLIGSTEWEMPNHPLWRD